MALRMANHITRQKHLGIKLSDEAAPPDAYHQKAAVRGQMGDVREYISPNDHRPVQTS